MINLSREEFEKYIDALIDEKYSKADLVKLLQTDYRTLNNKIQELVMTNPELYLRYIKKYPYRQKERDDIDYEALVIEAIKRVFMLKIWQINMVLVLEQFKEK